MPQAREFFSGCLGKNHRKSQQVELHKAAKAGKKQLAPEGGGRETVPCPAAGACVCKLSRPLTSTLIYSPELTHSLAFSTKEVRISTWAPLVQSRSPLTFKCTIEPYMRR